MAGLISRFKMSFLPQSLLARSLLIIATPLLLMQLIIGVVFFSRHWDTMTDKLAFALAGEIRILSNELVNAKSDEQISRIVENAANSLNINVTLSPNLSEALAPSDSSFQKFYWFSAGRKLDRALHNVLQVPFAVYPYEKDKWFEIVVQIKKDKVARFICSEKRLTSITTYIFMLWMIGSAAILFAIAMLFMRNQIRPILRLAIAAEKIGKGLDVPDFRPVGAREIRRASRAFLLMKERLKRQIEQRTAMLSGVSHDLRTPLTRMKLQLEMMPENEDTAALKTDISDMEKMLEGYLAFMRGEGDEAPESTDMGDLIQRAVANSRRTGADITVDIEDNTTMRVRPMAIERAIMNILSNAAKYATACTIKTEFSAERDYFYIMIDDNGRGIPEHQRDEVFRPFYRLEKSRNPKTGGVGLGLSIAQDIVLAHGGEITLGESDAGGLRVLIQLPA